MKITYLHNSAFALEWSDHFVIIDYYKHTPGSSIRDGVLRPQDFLKYPRVSVLATHGHGDHYNPVVLTWSQHREIDYVFGYDMEKKVNQPGAHFMRPGDWIQLGDLTITAFGSTDAGVSYHLKKGNLSLFHAGDLNNWHWQEESTAQEIAIAETDFLRELRVVSLHTLPLDVAFFPIDPRMKTDIHKGALQFVQQTRPTRLIPMHFGQFFPLTDKIREDLAPYSILTYLSNPGDSIEIKE